MSIEISVNELGLNNSLRGKRILIIVENLPLPFDRRVWMEAKTLKAAGATVSIICPTGKGHEKRAEVIDGINIYRHPLPLDASGAIGYFLEYSAALYWEFVLTLKVIFRHGVDVIQACNPPDIISLVVLPFKIFGIRFIFDHHDINPELYEAKFGRRGFFWKLLRLFERFTFALADVSIATNDSYREIAVKRGKMNEEKVFVVRSGPDLSKLVPQPESKKWHNKRDYLIGYVGVMGDQEGIDLLLESIDYLINKENRKDIQFVLVGGGPSLESLKAKSVELGLVNYVTFTGRAPDIELFEVLSNADICVNPDKFNEMNDKSTMNKVLEYMAFEKPIVQYDVCEGRYSAKDASLYAKPNDPVDFACKINKLLNNKKRRLAMGAFGKKRVESEMAWQFQIENLIKAYEKTLEIS